MNSSVYIAMGTSLALASCALVLAARIRRTGWQPDANLRMGRIAGTIGTLGFFLPSVHLLSKLFPAVTDVGQLAIFASSVFVAVLAGVGVYVGAHAAMWPFVKDAPGLHAPKRPLLRLVAGDNEH